MAEINVTPMVDVMLVLLIIFMVAAPLMIAGVPVNKRFRMLTRNPVFVHATASVCGISLEIIASILSPRSGPTPHPKGGESVCLAALLSSPLTGVLLPSGAWASTTRVPLWMACVSA